MRLNKLFLLLDAVLYYSLYILSILLSRLLILIILSVKTAVEYGDNLMLTGGGYFEQVIDTLSKQSLPGLLLSYFIFILMCYIVFKIKRINLYEYAGYGKIRFMSIIGSIATGVILNFIIISLMDLFTIPDKWIVNHNDAMTHLLEGNILFAVVVMVLIAPLFEEFFFRGVLFRTTQNAFGAIFAILITSVMFAFAHTNPVQSIYSFAAGIIFGIIRYKSKSLWSPTVAHISFNAANFFLVRTGMQSGIHSFLIYALLAISLASAFLPPLSSPYK